MVVFLLFYFIGYQTLHKIKKLLFKNLRVPSSGLKRKLNKIEESKNRRIEEPNMISLFISVVLTTMHTSYSDDCKSTVKYNDYNLCMINYYVLSILVLLVCPYFTIKMIYNMIQDKFYKSFFYLFIVVTLVYLLWIFFSLRRSLRGLKQWTTSIDFYLQVDFFSLVFLFISFTYGCKIHYVVLR